MSAPIKIVMLGEGRVGKTCLTLRYCQDQFNENQESSVNATYFDKVVDLGGGKDIKLAIWDTAGQEIFHALTTVYYRDAYGAVLVYDVTYKESFLKVEKWVEELRQFGTKDISIVVAGNKCDMKNQMQIDKNEVEEYCKKIGAKHFFTSAKAGIGIAELFRSLGESISIRVQAQESKGRKKKGLQIKDVKDSKKSNSKNDGCC
ncbi:unnamed protein product [Paramecium sonneborni]|uniref:Ras-related protein Rab-21 n=1 Tax=Paramecium sonneborni TaxID=65129 RepID=A0A8S1RGM5_9CILI|nr:unnamed protein product [Paramecium sonneborni]